jgi:geranylgeranyl pyrophosphate synthase
VHDDLIDDALLRRGQPTLNAGQNAKFTVLIGDYFFARAANLVAETDSVSIMSQFARTLMTILNGELTQQFSRWRIDRQNYYDRIYAKTGDLFVLAARAGATLGGANEASLLALESYGYHTGIAFQIIDDILDFTAQQTQLGKPVGSDLRQGLFTLPALLYIERYPDDPNLRTLLEVQDENHSAAENLIASIQTSGFIEEAMGEARSLVSRAKLALQETPQSEYTNALLSIADRIVDRNL